MDGFQQGKYNLPEGFGTVDFKAQANQPEYVVKQRQSESLKEQRKPEIIKKADLKMKEVDSKIIDASRELNAVRSAQSQNIQALQNLKDQLEDPMIPEDQKAGLSAVFQQTYNAALETEKTEAQARERAINLQKAKSSLKKVYEIQEKLDMDENDDALKATGNFLAHVYNAVPETIAGIGSLIESMGDVAANPMDIAYVPGDHKKNQERAIEDEADSKVTDVIGNAIQGMGNDLKAETDAKYDDKHYISSTIGDIVGSIAVAAVPGSMAAKYGKVAQITSGATTATMQMADGVHSKAKEIGLSDTDAGLMTLTIAPISGLLEVWGASNIIDNVAGKKIINELVTEATKKLAGKEITKEAVFNTVSETFKEVAKKHSLNIIKSAGKSGVEEGVTEGLQGEVEKAAENIYDATNDQEMYGTKFFSVDEQMDVAKQAALGAIAGSTIGAITGVSKPKDLYKRVVEMREDPSKIDRFRDMLATEVEAGHIDQESADNIKANINAMIEADKKVPPAITDNNKRLKAIELIKEKTILEEEIKGMDKAITTPQRDKIKEINSKLEAIATGKEPVKMERRTMGKKEKPVTTEPVVEEAKKVPLSDSEKIEYADLSRDQKLIGLEGKELERFNELKSRIEQPVQTEMKLDETIDEKNRSTEKPAITKSDIKESSDNSVFPLLDKKPATPKVDAGPSIVEPVAEVESTPERDKFVKEKLKKLKKDPGADYDVALEPVYKKHFEAEYDLLTENKLFEDDTENEGAIEQLPKTDSDEREPVVATIESKALDAGRISTEELEKGIAEAEALEQEEKKVHKLKGRLPVNFEKAMKHEVVSARDQALQYFIRGGKINKRAMQELFGGGRNGAKNVSSETKFREGYVDATPMKRDTDSGIESLAHYLWENQKNPDQFSSQDFRDAIEDVVLSHNSRKSMADQLNEAFREEATKQELAAKEIKEAQEKNPVTEAEESKVEKTMDDESNPPISDYEGDIPFQKVMESNKFTKSQKRVAKSITKVVAALKDIAPGLKVVLHETNDSFEKAAYQANKKLGVSEEKARKNVSGNAFYFGKDNVIHINLPNVRSNTLFHEGTHPILNMVEEMMPGTIDAMFEQLAGIEKKIGLEGHYTEDFIAPYGESVKKMEAVTEFIADVADGKVQISDGNFTKIKRFFSKLLKVLGIKIQSLEKDDIISLAKKVQKGFEKGELIDIATNRELREVIAGKYDQQEGVVFQDPGSNDQISEEDIKWALKTFQKLGNDFDLFRTKLTSTEAGRDLLSKNLFAAMLEYNSSRPQASTSDRLKAVSDHLHKADFISEDLKDKLEENGLRADVFSHEEARKIADATINLLGVDGAVDLAERRLKGSVRAFVYGAAIDYYAKRVAESTNTFERDYLAQKGADISEQFQKDAEDYGRFISAIGDYYKNSPLIIQKTVTNQLRTQAKQALAKMKASTNKVKTVKTGFSNVVTPPPAKPKTPRTTTGNNTARSAKRAELLTRWNNLKNSGGQQKQIDGFTQEQTDIMVEMGVIHVADGAWTFPAFYKKMKADLGISEKAARAVWEKEKMPAELDEKERTISAMLKEDFGDTEEYKRQQEALLNKYFPKKKFKTEKEHKDETDKIIEKYNAGVFDGGKNMDGEEFQKLFFDKLGIVDPDAPAIQAKIGELAERIGAAPDGSIFQREAKEDMLNYLANIAYQARWKATANRVSSIWYANILSSPATHLRNIQYNIISTAISQPFMLMEKAIIAKDYKAVPAMMKNMVEGFKKGLIESKRVMKTGRSSRFDVPVAQNDLERSKYAKPFVVPGRALKASDILFTDTAYATKLTELSRQLIRKEHPEYTPDQVDKASNELLGNTAERKEQAAIQAEKEMTDFYGPDWKNVKGAQDIYKIRQFEIMEKTIPAELKEQAIKYAKKSLLTSRPTGVLGVVADAINGLNERLYFTKFVMPFVNVPFNLVNAMVERSPLGLIKALRRAEGFGKWQEELNDDEVRELYLKVINYTVATVILAMMNSGDDDEGLVITGAQTGDYMDNKGIIRGGGLEPYSVYVGGKKAMSYKTSPWAAAFLIPGYMRDAKLYAKQEEFTDIAAYSGLNWLLFINDQSAMQGVQGLISTVAEAKKTSGSTVATTLAKYTQNIILPYSGALKFFNNNTKAIIGETDNRPIDPWEYLTKDVPFLDQVSRTRKDHFGQEVKETFEVPLLPVGHRGVVEAMSDTSEYYKLCKDNGYYPTFTTNRKMYVGGAEVTISKKDLDDINTDRGQLVKQALDSKNVFIPKEESDSDENLTEITTMEYLKTLDPEEFKKRMDDLFSEATKLARIRKYGEKVGITKKDVDKAKKKADELGGDIEYSKEEANKRLMEEYTEESGIKIAIDAY